MKLPKELQKVRKKGIVKYEGEFNSKKMLGVDKKDMGEGKFINRNDYQCKCSFIFDNMRELLMGGEHGLRPMEVDGDMKGEISLMIICPKCESWHKVSTDIAIQLS
ncbi:hypothetical protein ES705_23610 [subsurface metagenome]